MQFTVISTKFASTTVLAFTSTTVLAFTSTTVLALYSSNKLIIVIIIMSKLCLRVSKSTII